MNSTLLLPLAGGALAPGASVNVQFRLGVQKEGGFRFFINVEGLTAQPGDAENASPQKGARGKE